MTDHDQQRQQHPDATLTDRGFIHMQPLPSDYGGTIKVYESSSASGPHVWVRIECPADLNHPRGEMKEAVAHLRLSDAARLLSQLSFLVANHYQEIWRQDDEGEG